MYIFCINDSNSDYIGCLNGYELGYNLQGKTKWQHLCGIVNIA